MNTNLTTHAIDELSLSDLAALSASDLSFLQARVGDEERVLKARSEKLNAAIDRRYSEAARAAYLSAGKDTGTIHIDDAGHDVEVSVSKTVEWDQDKLASVLDGLPVETARHYAKAKFTIEERKFTAAPPDVRDLFSQARMVKPGKMRFVVKPAKAEAA